MPNGPLGADGNFVPGTSVYWLRMTPTETPVMSQVEQLLAENGYEVSELDGDLLRVRDLDTGITIQVSLQGNVLYMSVLLKQVQTAEITPQMMRKLLAIDNGISTSAFKLYEVGDGHTGITLNNFCTLQNMGPEDQDDILSLASYLMADLLEARDLLEGSGAGSQA
jgi:hypothetical protein